MFCSRTDDDKSADQLIAEEMGETSHAGPEDTLFGGSTSDTWMQYIHWSSTIL